MYWDTDILWHRILERLSESGSMDRSVWGGNDVRAGVANADGGQQGFAAGPIPGSAVPAVRTAADFCTPPGVALAGTAVPGL